MRIKAILLAACLVANGVFGLSTANALAPPEPRPDYRPAKLPAAD